jgi:hypothetical protein
VGFGGSVRLQGEESVEYGSCRQLSDCSSDNDTSLCWAKKRLDFGRRGRPAHFATGFSYKLQFGRCVTRPAEFAKSMMAFQLDSQVGYC